MNCSDFQANLDLYLDGELEDSVKRSASCHVTSCRTCDAVVTDHQKARALLITAVTDRVAAVDVSGIWREVEAKLERPRAQAVPANVTSLDDARARISRRSPRTAVTPMRLGALAAAAAAAIFAFTLFGGDRVEPPGTSMRTTLVASRPSRIDSMEVAAGHSVSTWVKPRTKTRVLWVASTGDGGGYSVSNASHSR